MVQPPTGNEPEQPPYGGQPPPYDPAQSPYAQPYGNQPPYGQPPYGAGGYYPPPPKQGNGFAIAGIILAILVPILGLIFSIIGLTKSKARAGAGKALSIAGIIVSVLVMGGGATLVAVLANSTAADPGCISAESAAHRITNTFNADAAAMTRDESNAPALRTDLNHFLNDVTTLQGEMTTAESQATHQSVKSQIAAVNSDLTTFSSSLQAIAQGDVSQVSQMESAASKVQNDGNALDSTCSSL
jgi:hypothetical protein